MIAIIHLFGILSPTHAEQRSDERAGYALNPETTSIRWTGKKITGKKHEGTVDLKEGTVEIESGKFIRGSVTIDMRTIENTDLGEKDKAKLEGHLKSDDFFSVDKYPVSSLVTKNVEETSANTYKVSADLTIKGITKPVTFTVEVRDRGNGFGLETEFKFDRSEFDVRYGSGNFFQNLGDNLIYDNVKLKINALANRE